MHHHRMEMISVFRFSITASDRCDSMRFLERLHGDVRVWVRVRVFGLHMDERRTFDVNASHESNAIVSPNTRKLIAQIFRRRADTCNAVCHFTRIVRSLIENHS